MRDGAKLCCDIYRAAVSDEKIPCLIIRHCWTCRRDCPPPPQCHRPRAEPPQGGDWRGHPPRPERFEDCPKWGLDLDKLGSPEANWYHELGADGNTHFKIPIFAKKEFDAPWLLNHRVDLHNELKRLATTEDGPGSPATIRTAAKVVRVDCEEGVVELQDGEVIKAADGIHSVARTAVLGDQLIAKRSGHSAYRALIPADIVTANPRIAHIVAGDAQGTGLTTYMGPDRRLVAYPCRRSQYLNIVAIVPDSEAEGSTEQWQVPGRPEQLLESFSAFCEDAKDILRNISSCALWQLHEQDPLETWTKGKVILIGDAAHAMLPPMPIPNPANTTHDTPELDCIDFSGKTVYGDFRDDIVRDGFAVVKNALSPERAQHYVQEIHQWLEDFGLVYKRDDPSTVKEECLPIIHQKGLLQAYGIPHERFTWGVRCEPGVIGVFEKLFNTEDLLVSFDIVNVSLARVSPHGLLP
ncbi:hypothetical protein AAT19DRAFT_11959 [Rhodotorula toruloides]|uniref:FAD-binding domain-containing protein n=1 Tax=Rhodotorula toruloides TaxID=5286 RepID=A0A2T0AEU9_RHOTO|nr:hypothetical protein AAT19DRAFT_11959 [Rhodotorula toruloides]